MADNDRPEESVVASVEGPGQGVAVESKKRSVDNVESVNSSSTTTTHTPEDAPPQTKKKRTQGKKPEKPSAKNRNVRGWEQKDENGYVVRKPMPNPFSAEEIAAEARRPKRKVAVLLGYSGTGYKGLQFNQYERTIEGDLFRAFVDAGAIMKANADDPRKSSFVRCSRTDKGVHAAGNVVSLKMTVDEEDPSRTVAAINEHLPEQIRVWGIVRTSNSFNCYRECNSRFYEYLLPSYALLPPHPNSYLGQKLREQAETLAQASDEGRARRDAWLARMADVEGFWEAIDEKEVKPILARLNEHDRRLTEARIHNLKNNLDDDYEAEDKEEELRMPEETGEPRETEESTAPEESGESEEPKKESAEVQTSEPTQPVSTELAGSAETKTDGAAPPSKKTRRQRREPTAVDFALRDIKEAYIAAKQKYRIAPARMDALQSALQLYCGTHNFHNYTVNMEGTNPSARRNIKSFAVDPKPVIVHDTEWISIKVHGQSFMLHQIRKMVCLAALVTRCGSDSQSIIPGTYAESARVAIPKAPSLGLLLERPVFGAYNARAQGSLGKAKLDFDVYTKDVIEPFKHEFIYKHIFAVEDQENTFHTFFQQIDNFRSDFFLWVTAGGIEAASQRDGKGDLKMQDKDGSDDEAGDEHGVDG